VHQSIGIDEDTAILVHDGHFRVIGRGAVYLMDGSGVTHSNIAEGETDTPLSIYDLRLQEMGLIYRRDDPKTPTEKWRGPTPTFLLRAPDNRGAHRHQPAAAQRLAVADVCPQARLMAES
jgi:hypothetical protein